MDLEIIILREVSQSEKVQYCMIPLISEIEWAKWTNVQNADRLRQQADRCWGMDHGWRAEGLNKKYKKRKKEIDMDDSVVITGGGGCGGR